MLSVTYISKLISGSFSRPNLFGRRWASSLGHTVAGGGPHFLATLYAIDNIDVKKILFVLALED